MKYFLLAVSFSFLLSVPLAGASEWEGTHPYDNPERIVRGNTHRNNKRTWGYNEIQRFYASRYRTYTHMLHPYYRRAPYQRYGRIPDNRFNYSYEHFAGEVIRSDRMY